MLCVRVLVPRPSLLHGGSGIGNQGPNSNVSASQMIARGAQNPRSPTGHKLKEFVMSWTTPVICEVCAGMEVTAYLTAGK
jgi:coenzyme PQQ precursor peptide PqqA